MKYRISARVDGFLYLEQPRSTVVARNDDFTFEIESDETGRVVSASVTAPIPAEKAAAFFAAFTPTPDKETKAHLHFATDGEFHKSLITKLQEFAGHLASLGESSQGGA